MRLIYLDEAGIDHGAPFLVVAGVMIHGDFEWPEVNERINALIEKYIPESDRLGFFFHATDIYHGSGYFDRRKPEWNSEQKRWAILLDLAKIIDDMSLPVVAGGYVKGTFGSEELRAGTTVTARHNMMHDAAALDCLLWADRWLAKFAPVELATVIHEDGTKAKQLIKVTVRVMRSVELLSAWDFDCSSLTELELPLKRIIDTVHFAEKSDARPLQLADLCAFILGRAQKEKHVPIGVFEIIFRHVRWIMEIQGKGAEVKKALDALAQPVGPEAFDDGRGLPS